MPKRSRDELIYTKIALTAVAILVAAASIFFFFFQGQTVAQGISKIFSVMSPFFFGGAIAYILNPVMQYAENLLLKFLIRIKKPPREKGVRAVRMISILISILLAVVIVYAIIAMLVPQLVQSIRNILVSWPTYIQNVTNWFNNTFTNADEQTSEYFQQAMNIIYSAEQMLQERITPGLNKLVTTVTDSILDLVNFFKNVFLGLIIAAYMLASKERMIARAHRALYALLSVPKANSLIRTVRFVDEKFGGFLLGKLMDSFIIGLITYVCVTLMKMPYPVLLAVVIGVTNVIPFFGPFIGAIPTAFLVFCVNPIQALYFVIFILVLQQFDGNFLGPRILGNSVGVSSFMVLMSILIGSGFFGVPGMIAAVPVAAVLSSLLQTTLLRNLARRGLPGGLEAWRHMDSVDPETRRIINDENTQGSKILYNTIKQKSPEVKALEVPLKEAPWDRTLAQVEEEDRRFAEEMKADHDFLTTRNHPSASDDPRKT